MRIVITAVLLLSGTVLIQIAAQTALVWMSRNMTTLRGVAHIVLAVLVLVTGHVLQVTLWAAYYQYGPSSISGSGTALYYSLANFTTVGAADVTLPHPDRLVGALEAAAGMLVFGWSTALLVRVVQRADRDT